MRLLSVLLGVIPVLVAQETATTTTTDNLLTLEGQVVRTTPESVPIPSGSYLTYSTTRILETNSHGSVITPTVNASSSSAFASANASNTSTIAVTTTSSQRLVLVGGQTTTMGNATNATATSTSSASSTPTNTRPCNGYPEFCSRKYSNITMLTAHNSPFNVPDNIASNQALPVKTQLDDGIRMLQFQVHHVNGTMYLCHTKCELLNVGPLEDYLKEVAEWVNDHPYDVVTILMGNYDQVAPHNFIAPVENSGLKRYVYTPPKIPMALDDWPTLGSMILSGTRVPIFLDYQANPKKIPWLMDEFSQMWETPFSPTNRHFPCTEQRPPGLSRKDAEDRMYLANHNLNLEVDFAGLDILIPNLALIDETNAASGFGSLGRMAENCTHKWDRPPNFLLVDYYNYGDPNGTVFRVAAEMNNVTYNGECCGTQSSASSLMSLNTLSISFIALSVQYLAGLF